MNTIKMKYTSLRHLLNYNFDKYAENGDSLINRLFDTIRFRYKCYRLRDEIRSVDYEMSEFKLMKLLLLHRPGISIDAGANYGTFSFFLSKYSRRVMAFEPISFSCRLLEYLLNKHGVKNVSIYKEALSNHRGWENVAIPVVDGTRNYFLASLESVEQEGEAPSESEVFCSTIDYHTADLTDITLIKIDVEGHEHAVIQGATATLQKWKPALLVEFNHPPIKHNEASYQIYEELRNLGYWCFYCDATGVYRCWNESARPTHVNYFFLSREDAVMLAEQSDRLVFQE